jgi:outer membrane biogenesis lipoprotein LolB
MNNKMQSKTIFLLLACSVLLFGCTQQAEPNTQNQGLGQDAPQLEETGSGLEGSAGQELSENQLENEVNDIAGEIDGMLAEIENA